MAGDFGFFTLIQRGDQPTRSGRSRCLETKFNVCYCSGPIARTIPANHWNRSKCDRPPTRHQRHESL